MLQKLKKNINLIFILIILFSLIFFYLFYNASVKKEKQAEIRVHSKELLLKDIKVHIKNKKTEIRKINIKSLIFNYFSKENNYFFSSKISKTAINSNLHLNYIHYKGLKKYPYGKIYMFSMAGSGNFISIYNFIKALEYKYRLMITNFMLKDDKKSHFLLFNSKLKIYEIKKDYLASPVSFSQFNKSNPPFIYQKKSNPFNISTNINIIKKKKIKLIKKIKTEHNYAKSVKKPCRKVYIAKTIEKAYSKTPYHAPELKKKAEIKIIDKYKKSEEYNRKGIRLFKNKRYGAALNNFKKSILFNPRNYIALSNTALDYYIKKNYNKAKFYIKKAIKIKNSKWQFYFILGLIHLKHNQLKLSRINFKKAYRLDPENKKLLYYINRY
jgi:tetratricopeptide (TPR) repeat protein